MAESTRKEKTENLQSLLRQLEENINTGIALKSRVERALRYSADRSLVREPSGMYRGKQTGITLMPDYYIDDSGKVTDIEFTLVKESQHSI